MGTSTRAGRNAFIAREAIARRERLGEQLLPTFRTQMDQFIELFAQLGAREWAKPAYNALRIVPLWHYLYIMIHELALHAWDIRSRLDSTARLSVESLPALMQRIPLQLVPGGPAGVAFGHEASPSLPVRYRWEVTGVVPGSHDIVMADGTCRMELASTAAVNVIFHGEAETFVLLMSGRLILESAIATGRLRAEGEHELIAAFERWLRGA